MTENQLDDRVRGAVGAKVPGVAVVVVGAEGVRARSAVGIADLISRRPMATDIDFDRQGVAAGAMQPHHRFCFPVG
jgi:hypothetical protein